VILWPLLYFTKRKSFPHFTITPCLHVTFLVWQKICHKITNMYK
jgi:hypothetical protein